MSDVFLRVNGVPVMEEIASLRKERDDWRDVAVKNGEHRDALIRVLGDLVQNGHGDMCSQVRFDEAACDCGLRTAIKVLSTIPK